MWQPKKIGVENFLGFRDYQEYEIQNGRAVLIQGVNNTDSETESNGSGKTSFQEVFHYGYLGTASRKGVVDKELIHWGEEKSKLYLKLLNTVTKQVLEIERTISKKSSSTLKIVLDNEDQRDKFPTVAEGNKYLVELIGVSQKDFQNYYLINDEKYKSFFISSDSEKKDFIGRFSKADSVLTALDKIDKELDSKTQEIKEKQRELSELEGEIRVHEESLREIENFDYTEIKVKLREENREVLEKLEGLVEEDEKTLLSLQPEVGKIQNRLDCIDHRLKFLQTLSYKDKIRNIETSQESIKKTRREIQKEWDSINSDLTTFKEELSGILVELSDVITCPKCRYNFTLQGAEVNKEELELLKREVEEQIESLTQAQLSKTQLDTKKSQELQELLKKLEQFNKKERRIAKFIETLESEQKILKRKLSNQEVKKTSLETSIKKNKELLALEKKFSITAEVNKVKENNSVKAQKIKEKHRLCLEKKSKLQTELDTVTDERLGVAKWTVNFKRFYTNLVNKSLLVMQGHANTFLQKMGTDLQLQLEGYKVLASGDIREQISCSLLRNGVREGSTNSGSKGERKRLECSIIVANQTIINNSCKTGGLDLLFIDEVLDGVDGTGMQSLINSLTQLNKTIFLTTHITPKNLPENVLIIEKTKGVSKIVAN